jgi:hypothetical protein
VIDRFDGRKGPDAAWKPMGTVQLLLSECDLMLASQLLAFRALGRGSVSLSPPPRTLLPWKAKRQPGRCIFPPL